jgi:alpha-soluble NSF attachment protein
LFGVGFVGFFLVLVRRIEKGEKKLKGWFGGSGKYEEAAEMFEKAANLYKMSKQCKEKGNSFFFFFDFFFFFFQKGDEAGEAYRRVADCQKNAKSNHEAASSLVNAATCFKKSNVKSAIRALREAVDLYQDEGRFSIAAKQQKEIAELCEKELDFEGAIDEYKAAADMFDGEDATSSSNACLLKVALFSAQLERFKEAIEIYEKIAAKSIDNNLLKWSVKDYLFRAGLCHLALGDFVGAKRAIDKYEEMDQSFQSSREGKFLREVLDAVEKYDVESFTNAVVEFDSITKLDSWKTSVLLKIKNQIKGKSGGDDDDADATPPVRSPSKQTPKKVDNSDDDNDDDDNGDNLARSNSKSASKAAAANDSDSDDAAPAPKKTTSTRKPANDDDDDNDDDNLT